MENRRTIRNWDAFGRIYRFASRLVATEMVEPVLKLVFDISAALLLAVTFVFQTLSVLIAFDVVVVGFYHVFCTQMCKIMSALLFFTTNEREKNAAFTALIRFVSNVVWVRLIYTVHKDCWIYMAGGPLFCIALMHTLVNLYAERLSTEQSALTQITYSLFLLSLFLMVFNTIGGAPDHILMETVFLLRTPIDTLCNSVDTIFKLFDSILAVDNNMPVYTTQIARYSFWTSVHLLQFLLVISGDRNGEPSRRGDRVLYFTLFLHDLLDLMVPVKQLLTQIRHERIIAKTFPRISAIELSSLADENCSVCLSHHNAETVRLRCNHLLHTQCLHRILQQNADSHSDQPSRCPMCRATIELPSEARNGAGGLFGAGTRGSRARAINHPLFNYIVGESNRANNALAYTADGDGTPRAGNAQDLIAEHLGQHNLQQGDVIHIRIIPSRARQQQQMAAATAAVTAAAAAAGATVPRATTSASTSTVATGLPTPSPLTPHHVQTQEDADLFSALQGIHAHGLHSESETGSATSSATGSVVPSTRTSSSQLSSRPSQSNISLVRLNVRNRTTSSSTLRTLVSSLVQSGHLNAEEAAALTAAPADGQFIPASTHMDVVSDIPSSGTVVDAPATSGASTEGGTKLSALERLLQERAEFEQQHGVNSTYNGPFSVDDSSEDQDTMSGSEGEDDGETESENEDNEENEDQNDHDEGMSYSSTAHSSDTEDTHAMLPAAATTSTAVPVPATTAATDAGALMPEECAELAQILCEDTVDSAILCDVECSADRPDAPLPADPAVGQKRSHSEAELTSTSTQAPLCAQASSHSDAPQEGVSASATTTCSSVSAAAETEADVAEDRSKQGTDNKACDDLSPAKRLKVSDPAETQVDYGYGCTQCSPVASEEEGGEDQ